jgi:hypothetical protein
MENNMKTTNRLIYLLLILASVWGFLSLATHNAQADGGGFPTTTPTSTTVSAQIVIQPPEGKDELPAAATPAEIQESAPLPEAPTSGDQLLPGLQAATATNSSILSSQTNGVSNFRFFVTAGILLVVVLVVGFIVFRLRA